LPSPRPRAILLAAGRGQRLRPLTDHTPKPLVPVGGRPLIEWHLLALARAGVREVVINTAWLEDQLVAALGDGTRWGLAIHWSLEGRDHGGALETAGGIATALPLLANGPDDPFWIVSADVLAPDFAFESSAVERFAAGGLDAHLWLVDNPPYHPQGDFGLGADGLALADGPGPDGRRWTYANLALARPALFAGIAPGTVARLGPVLAAAMRGRRVSAGRYPGRWANVGTAAELESAQALVGG
jgi:N-acetyl-alpha-D-muramate 1-phosphate uridylyltransferase